MVVLREPITVVIKPFYKINYLIMKTPVLCVWKINYCVMKTLSDLCICIHLYVYVYVYAHVYIHIYVYVCLYVCEIVYFYKCLSIYLECEMTLSFIVFRLVWLNAADVYPLCNRTHFQCYWSICPFLKNLVRTYKWGFVFIFCVIT